MSDFTAIRGLPAHISLPPKQLYFTHTQPLPHVQIVYNFKQGVAYDPQSISFSFNISIT
jgi:hypothetical protein